MPAPFQYVRCGMPSEDWMYVRVRAHEAVDVVGADPASLIAATHASRASDAGVTSPLSRRKPVVAALANATWSLAGFASPIMARPRAGTRGNGRPSRSIQSSSTGVPMTMSSFDASTTVLVNRRPSCSSSSTVTTGCGPAW